MSEVSLTLNRKRCYIGQKLKHSYHLAKGFKGANILRFHNSNG